jgi:hypothetical protein
MCSYSKGRQDRAISAFSLHDFIACDACSHIRSAIDIIALINDFVRPHPRTEMFLHLD